MSANNKVKLQKSIKRQKKEVVILKIKRNCVSHYLVIMMGGHWYPNIIKPLGNTASINPQYSLVPSSYFIFNNSWGTI